MMARGVWRLHVGGKNNLSIIPHDLGYFDDATFFGKPMSDDWTPPPIEIAGKSKKLRDFVGWMIRAPIVSGRAKMVLEGVFGEYLQFLEFHEIKSRKYYAMNVIRVEKNAVDMGKSRIDYAVGDRTHAFATPSVYFVAGVQLPPVFKLDLLPSEIYVTERFAEVVISEKLTGLSLADPSQDPLPLILSGKSLNVVDGVIE